MYLEEDDFERPSVKGKGFVVRKCKTDGCGVEFTTAKGGDQRHCKYCEKHVLKIEKPKFQYSEKGIYTNCPNCGKEFLKRQKNHKYCSVECLDDATKASSQADMYVIFERDNFTCRYCGSSPAKDDRVRLEIDHIHPHSKGGLDTAGNLVTACSRCNGSKNNNLLSEESLEFVLEQVKERNLKSGIPNDKPIKGTHARGGLRTRSPRFLGEKEE